MSNDGFKRKVRLFQLFQGLATSILFISIPLAILNYLNDIYLYSIETIVCLSRDRLQNIVFLMKVYFLFSSFSD